MPVWIGAGAALLIVFFVMIFVFVRRLQNTAMRRPKPVDKTTAIEGGSARKPLAEGTDQSAFEEQAMAMLADNGAAGSDQNADGLMRLPSHEEVRGPEEGDFGAGQGQSAHRATDADMDHG